LFCIGGERRWRRWRRRGGDVGTQNGWDIRRVEAKEGSLGEEVIDTYEYVCDVYCFALEVKEEWRSY
jgi:hypothetical protein